MDSDSEGPAVGDYNDGNRAFLQSFMARGSMTFKEGQQLLASIFTVQEGRETRPSDVTQEDFDSYLAAAAKVLSPFDYEIRSMRNQANGTMIWALVNSTSDPLTQVATTHTPEEMGFIKRLLDAMFETFNTKKHEVMAITSLQALAGKIIKGASRDNEAGEEAANTQTVDKGLTKDQAEKTLNSLVLEGWMLRSKEGYHSLSPRAVMELRGWLVDTYNDSEDPDEWQRIKFCEACKGIITIGQRCIDQDCNVRLHNICQTAYWNSRPSKKCPKCNTEWDGTKYVGQKVITSTDEYLRGKRRSGGPAAARANNEAGEDGEANDANDASMADE